MSSPTKQAQESATENESEVEDFRQLIHRKEADLFKLYNEKFDQLIKKLKKQDNELQLLRKRYSQLQEDALYNLQLIDARDRELEKLERALENEKSENAEKTAQLLSLTTAHQISRTDLNQLRTLLENNTAQFDLERRRLDREMEQLKRIHEEEIQALNQTHAQEKSAWKLDKENLVLESESVKQDLIDQLRRVRDEVENQTNRIERYQEAWELERKSLQAELEKTNARLASAEQTTIEWRKANDKLERNVMTLEAEKRSLRSELQETRALLNRKEKEWEMKVTKLEDDREVLLRQHESQIRDLNESNARNLQHESEKTRIAIEKTTNLAKEYQIKIQELQNQVRTFENLNHEKERLYQQEIEQREKLEGDIELLKDQLSQSQRQVDAVKEDFLQWKTLAEQLEQKCETLELEYQERYNELREQARSEHEQVIQGLVSEKIASEQKCQVLEQRLLGSDFNCSERSRLLANERDVLKEENQQLFMIVRQMRQEMEHLQNLSLNNRGNSRGSEDAREIQQLKEDLKSKDALIDQMSRQMIDAWRRMATSRIGVETPAPVTGHVDDYPSDANTGASSRQSGTVPIAKYMSLKKKLASCVSDLERMLREKKLLVDMSNDMRAQLNDVMNESRRQKSEKSSVEIQTENEMSSELAIRKIPKLNQDAVKAKSLVVHKERTSLPKRILKVKSNELTHPCDEKHRKLTERIRGIRNWNEKDDLT